MVAQKVPLFPLQLLHDAVLTKNITITSLMLLPSCPSARFPSHTLRTSVSASSLPSSTAPPFGCTPRSPVKSPFGWPSSSTFDGRFADADPHARGSAHPICPGSPSRRHCYRRRACGDWRWWRWACGRSPADCGSYGLYYYYENMTLYTERRQGVTKICHPRYYSFV